MDFNDSEVHFNSLSKRLLCCLPQTNVKSLFLLSSFVKNLLSVFVDPPSVYMSFVEWLLTTAYNEKDKEIFRECYRLNQYTGGRPPIDEAHRALVHNKRESYPKIKNARFIIDRGRRFGAWFGPLCKTMEHIIYEWEDDITETRQFVKGLRPMEVIALVNKLAEKCKGYWVLEVDHVAFEAHFPRSVMNCLEMQLYKHMLRKHDYHYLSRVIGGLNKLRSRHGLKATVEGRRMSGEHSTSLANGFSNLMIMKFIAKTHDIQCHGFVEGDDGLFFVDKQFKAEWFTELGFEVKLKHFSDLHDAGFCGRIFSEDNQIIKSPYRFVQKFGWCDRYIDCSETKAQELLLAKSLSTLEENPDCPIIGKLAEYYANKLHNLGLKPRFIKDNYHMIPKIDSEIRKPNPTIGTRNLFARHFAITPAEQINIEDLIGKGDIKQACERIASWCPLHDLDIARDNLKYASLCVHYGRALVVALSRKPPFAILNDCNLTIN